MKSIQNKWCGSKFRYRNWGLLGEPPNVKQAWDYQLLHVGSVTISFSYPIWSLSSLSTLPRPHWITTMFMLSRDGGSLIQKRPLDLIRLIDTTCTSHFWKNHGTGLLVCQAKSWSMTHSSVPIRVVYRSLNLISSQGFSGV